MLLPHAPPDRRGRVAEQDLGAPAREKCAESSSNWACSRLHLLPRRIRPWRLARVDAGDLRVARTGAVSLSSQSSSTGIACAERLTTRSPRTCSMPEVERRRVVELARMRARTSVAPCARAISSVASVEPLSTTRTSSSKSPRWPRSVSRQRPISSLSLSVRIDDARSRCHRSAQAARSRRPVASSERSRRLRTLCWRRR